MQRNEDSGHSQPLDARMDFSDSLLHIRDVVELPLKTKENPLDLLVSDGMLPVTVPGRYDIRAPFPEQKT